ncbi:MAG: arylformamidase [Parvularculaceae bacterium]
MKLIDISPALDASSPVFPGDTPFRAARVAALDGECPVNVSKVETTVHIGAHADAPLHYDKGGAPIDEVSLEAYIGPASVIHAIGCDAVSAELIAAKAKARALAPRVLIRTFKSTPTDRWEENFAPIEPGAIDTLAAMGVILIGVDTPSLDPASSKTMDAHRRVFANDMRILEGLVLDHVDEGDYELIAPPLKLKGLDAAPCRALLRMR